MHEADGHGVHDKDSAVDLGAVGGVAVVPWTSRHQATEGQLG